MVQELGLGPEYAPPPLNSHYETRKPPLCFSILIMLLLRDKRYLYMKTETLRISTYTPLNTKDVDLRESAGIVALVDSAYPVVHPPVHQHGRVVHLFEFEFWGSRLGV